MFDMFLMRNNELERAHFLLVSLCRNKAFAWSKFYIDLLLMAKQDQRQLVSSPTRKKTNSGAQDADFHYEDSWVVVNKQKVTILIPALPVTEQLILPPDDSGNHTPLASLRKKTTLELECSDKLCSPNCSVSQNDKSISLDPKTVLPTAKTVHPLHSHLVPELPKTRPSISSEYPQINTVRVRHSMGTFSGIKVRKQELFTGDGQSTMNTGMRASIIKRKLQRAGGLNNWLVSIGLHRFVKLFQQRHVNKFQLANLTMKKLKDMGAQAVGPRRKLMHAIDCLCQPYCFERL